jgi:uncharacterized OsmC-like protein
MADGTLERIARASGEATAYLRDHPEHALSQDLPATAGLVGGLRCRVVHPKIGTVIESDMVRGIGGEGAAPTPGWLLRAALATCDATMIALRAAQEGISLTTLEVTATSESDDRGLLGAGDAPAGPLRGQVQVRLAADGVPGASLRAIVEWAEAHSPVGDALRRAVPLTTEVTIG